MASKRDKRSSSPVDIQGTKTAIVMAEKKILIQLQDKNSPKEKVYRRSEKQLEKLSLSPDKAGYNLHPVVLHIDFPIVLHLLSLPVVLIVYLQLILCFTFFLE